MKIMKMDMKIQHYKDNWKKFFKNWKEVVRNPLISKNEKCILFDVWLYRSDGEGWYLSERKLANDFGMGKQTVSKAIDRLVERELLIKDNSKERERRKLKLSGLLRSPVSIQSNPRVWVSYEPTKYIRKYRINKSFNQKEEVSRALTPEEMSSRIGELKRKSLLSK